MFPIYFSFAVLHRSEHHKRNVLGNQSFVSRDNISSNCSPLEHALENKDKFKLSGLHEYLIKCYIDLFLFNILM